jgi:hypothetical protein
MKDMVLVPIKFAILLMLFLSMGTMMQVVIDYSRLSSTLQQDWTSTVSLLTVNGFFVWIVPGLLLAWLFTSLGIFRRGKAKRTRMVFLTVLVSGTMFSVLYFMPPLDKVRSHVSELDFQVPDKVILTNSEAFFVYAGNQDDKSGSVLLHRNGPDARFRLIPAAEKDTNAGKLVLGAGESPIDMDGLVGGRRALFENDGVLEPVFGIMLDGLVAFQKGRPGELIPAAALSAATGLLLASFWLFVRLTKWPLANLVLSLAVLAGMVVLPSLIGSPLGRGLLSFVPDVLRTYTLPGIYLLVSILCFGGCLLQPSTRDWQPGADE